MTEKDLDKGVLNLMGIIADLETRGQKNPYQTKGDLHLKGGSYGRFQYRPDTWKEVAGKYLGDPRAEMTPANQEKATYFRIKDWKDQGLTPIEIDALWNGATKTPTGYVHNAKDREAKFKNAYFAKVGTIKAPEPVEEKKFGPRQETEGEQLTRIQNQKVLKDQADLESQANREGVVEQTLGGAKDFVKGIGNYAERTAGNTLTFGNTVLNKLGMGTDNPVLVKGTEANKFATGEGTAGTNFMQKLGGAASEVASVVAPVPGLNKLTTAMKGTEFLKGLAGGGKIASFTAKAIPLGVEGAVQGAATDVLNTGDVSLGNTIGYGLTNVGANKIFSALGRKTGVVDDVMKKFESALEKGDQKTAEALKSSPEMQTFLFSKGLTSPEAINRKAAEEVQTVKGLLSEAGNAEKGYNLSNLPDEDIMTFLEIHKPGIKTTNGQLSYKESWSNAEKQKSIIGEKIDSVKKALSEDKTNPLNRINLDEIEVMAKNIAAKRKVTSRATKQQEIDDAITREIQTLKSRLNGKQPNFGVVDDIRIAGNERSYDVSDVGNAKDIANRFLADAVRQKTDEVLETLLKNADADGAEAIKHFKDLNKAYGNLTGAQDVIKGLEKVPKTQQNRLTTLLGATIATGGGYNPIAFLAGSFVTDKIVQAFKRVASKAQTPSVANKIGSQGLSDTMDIINKLKTKKIKAPKTQPALKDPRSLRDILLNTPR